MDWVNVVIMVVAVVFGLLGRMDLGVLLALLGNMIVFALFGGLAYKRKGMAVVGDFHTWQLWSAILVGLSPLLLALDGQLSRLDGLLMLLIYAIYSHGIASVRRFDGSFLPKAIHLDGVLARVINGSTLVVGVVVLLRPGDLSMKLLLIGSLGFVVLFGLFWLFVSVKKKISQGKG